MQRGLCRCRKKISDVFDQRFLGEGDRAESVSFVFIITRTPIVIARIEALAVELVIKYLAPQVRHLKCD